MQNESLVIVGVGSGLGTSLARRFAKSGFSISLVALSSGSLNVELRPWLEKF